MGSRRNTRSKRRTAGVGLYAVSFAALLLAAACGGTERAGAPAATTSVQAPAPDTRPGDVLAVVGDDEITLDDLDAVTSERLSAMDFEYRSQRHQVVDQAMRRAVRDKLIEAEAEERGVTVDELVRETVGDRDQIGDEAVRTFYLQNQAQLQGRTYESIAPQIRDYLATQARESALQELADGIADEHGAAYMLEPFRVDIDITGAPTAGPDDAPVTLVEFSDFQCPYCESFVPTLERVQQEYGDQVRVAFLHFPLRQIHPDAQKAAEASMCAFEQGKFWEAHDLYFAEQQALGVDDLKEKAARLELDADAFAECLDSGKYVDYIDEDVSTAIAMGVDGTPAIFVNGRPLPGGAVPFEMLSEIIDEELERQER